MSKEDKAILETQQPEADLEIADLEYDVGGVGSLEGADAPVNFSADFVIMVSPKSKLPS